jgi:hypothetical protein
MRDNHGIVGDVRAQNVAVGPHASIHVDAALRADVASALEALRRAIASHDASPEVRETLTRNAEELQEEIARPAPDPTTLQTRLKTIVALAGAASGVAVAADDLIALVQHVV